MPDPVSVTPALNVDLGISSNDRIKYHLLFAKVAGTATQVVDLTALATTLATTDDAISVAIRGLENSNALSAAYSNISLIWAAPPDVTMTAAEAQAIWNSKLLDDVGYYVYLALALTKTASPTQTITLATYTAAPWNIPRTNLINEIQKFAARRPSTARPTYAPPFSADFSTVTLTWLSPNVP
jgi:hypothetical protein